MGLGCLRLPRRDGRRVHAISDAGDDTADDEVRQFECRTLQRRANSHNNRANEDGFLAAKYLADPDSRNSAEETAYIIRSDRNT